MTSQLLTRVADFRGLARQTRGVEALRLWPTLALWCTGGVRVVLPAAVVRAVVATTEATRRAHITLALCALREKRADNT